MLEKRHYEIEPMNRRAMTNHITPDETVLTDTLESSGIYVRSGQAIRIDVANAEYLRVAIGRPDFGSVQWVKLRNGANILSANKNGILHFSNQLDGKTASVEIYGVVD